MSGEIIFLIIIFLLVSGLFSSSETAFLSLNRLKLSALERQGNKKARGIRKILKRIDLFLSTILIGNTLSNAALASLTTYVLGESLGQGAKSVFWATVISTVLILVLSEMFPKTVAANYPEELSFREYPWIKFFMTVFKPLALFFTWLVRGMMGILGLKTREPFSSLTREELKALVFSGTETEDFFMLKRLLLLEDKKLAEVMVPRVRMVAVNEGATYDEVLSIIRKYHFSRYPVYKEEIDKISGILNVKDFISVSPQQFHLRDIIKAAHFFPIYAKIDEVFDTMRKRRIHMALVVDEFGTIRGLVTLEDLLEEIVGEIWDEYETPGEEDEVKEIRPGLFIIKGDADPREVEEKLGIELPGDGFNIFAGFVLKIMGRVPEEGESFHFQNWEFKIRRMLKNYIVEVEARRKDESSGHQQES